MKCLVCPNTIDEFREFPVSHAPNGQAMQDAPGKYAHEVALATWRHVTVTVQAGGGSLAVLNGHICPEEKADTLTFAPSTKKGKTP
jgi:hypothetical protein